MNSKIQNDIKELVEAQVISQDTAFKITSYYQSKQVDSPNRLFTVFAVLGSTLVGLGIILILAHNWDDFSRTIKTVFAFLPLIIGQLCVGYSILKKKSVTWKEASGVFLFFAVGSSMALVSQIYNIPGNLSSYLLTWTILGLPLVYLLRSNALGILHIVFATYYAVEHGYLYNSSGTPWLYILLIVAILPYYSTLLKQKATANITSVFNWLVPLSIIIVLGTFIESNGVFGYLMYVSLFGLLYNLGKLPYFNNQKLRKNGYLVLGSLGTVYMLLLASFEWLWTDLFSEVMLFNSQEFYIYIFFFLLAFVVLIYGKKNNWLKGINLFQYLFIIFSIIFFIGFSNDIFPVILINLLVLALGVMAIKLGADKLHFGVLNYGLLIITILIVCRFFDTNMSFVLRGLLFVGVGFGFFFTNYLMLKKQKKLKS
ncbi:DUF2157 domain-containing protein [Thalassobellus citreus]|uniref:DUF2157 domain-containing protein n=1 Tax=Thalassobellus citreus TaxID=3367752 RepID=UPI0037B60F98